MAQKLLILTSTNQSPRSEVVSWEAHDPDLVFEEPQKHGWRHQNIEAVREAGYSKYETVLYAMADGWRLMTPPTRTPDNFWVWWLSRLN